MVKVRQCVAMQSILTHHILFASAPVISTTFTSTSKSTSRKTGSAKEIQMGSEDLELQRKKEREWKRNQRKHRSPEAKQATNAKEAERQKEYRLKKKIISIRDGTRHKEREGTESCQSHKLNVKGYWYNKWVSVTRWDDQNQNGTVVVMQSVGGLRGSFSSAARIYS